MLHFLEKCERAKGGDTAQKKNDVVQRESNNARMNDDVVRKCRDTRITGGDIRKIDDNFCVMKCASFVPADTFVR